MVSKQAVVASLIGGAAAAAIAASAESVIGEKALVLMVLLWPVLLWRFVGGVAQRPRATRAMVTFGAIGAPTLFFFGVFLGNAIAFWNIFLLWAMIVLVALIAVAWLVGNDRAGLPALVRAGGLSAIILVASALTLGGFAWYDSWQEGIACGDCDADVSVDVGGDAVPLLIGISLVGILIVGVPQFVAVAVIAEFAANRFAKAPDGEANHPDAGLDGPASANETDADE